MLSWFCDSQFSGTWTLQFLDATTHIYKRSCPSVRPVLFSNDEFVCFEGKKSSDDMINETMSEDEVVASYLFLVKIHFIEYTLFLIRTPL